MGYGINRQFEQVLPNRIWVCDIAYIRTLSSWLYLAAVLDFPPREIVSWAGLKLRPCQQHWSVQLC